MKNIYEEPQLFLIGFVAAENLAADWDWSSQFENDDQDDASGFEIELPNNPEGGF